MRWAPGAWQLTRPRTSGAALATFLWYQPSKRFPRLHYAWGRPDASLFEIVMERCTGGELLRFVEENYPDGITQEEASLVFREIVRAVQYLHEGVRVGGRRVRMLHRDLKPANILVRGDNVTDVVVCDLGACKIEGVQDPNEHAVCGAHTPTLDGAEPVARTCYIRNASMTHPPCYWPRLSVHRHQDLRCARSVRRVLEQAVRS